MKYAYKFLLAEKYHNYNCLRNFVIMQCWPKPFLKRANVLNGSHAPHTAILFHTFFFSLLLYRYLSLSFSIPPGLYNTLRGCSSHPQFNTVRRRRYLPLYTILVVKNSLATDEAGLGKVNASQNRHLQRHSLQLACPLISEPYWIRLPVIWINCNRINCGYIMSTINP